MLSAQQRRCPRGARWSTGPGAAARSSTEQEAIKVSFLFAAQTAATMDEEAGADA